MSRLDKWYRLFPFALDAHQCEDCGAYMSTEYVQAPAVQDHWRGVEAWVCADCDRVEYKDA